MNEMNGELFRVLIEMIECLERRIDSIGDYPIERDQLLEVASLIRDLYRTQDKNTCAIA